MVVLESPLYRWMQKLAKREGLSLSMKMRDIVREAYEHYEDRYWAKEGAKRLKGFKTSEALDHAKFWEKVGR